MSGKDNRFDGDLIGVDVGGTFTDLIRLDQASGAVRRPRNGAVYPPFPREFLEKNQRNLGGQNHW